MAFVDFVRSIYQDQHKAKPLAFTSVEEGKNVRIQKQAKERRSRRIDAFASNRAMEEDDVPLTPQLDIPAPKKEVTDPRKKQMLLWKQERLKRKKLEPKKPPPFKVGVVRHAIAPFQEEIFKNPVKPTIVNEVTVTSQRVTRSTTRANLKVCKPLAVQKPPVQQKSFAPLNAKFHAPKVNVVERKNQKFKYTPRKPKLGEINNKLFSNLFPLDKSPKKSPKSNKKNLRSKKDVNIVKMSAKKRKSIKDDFLVELVDTELKAHGVELKRVTSSPSTPRSTPQGIQPNGSVSKNIKSEINGFASPEPSNPDSNILISSPFVTVGRGKSNKEKESAIKLKYGYTHMSPEKTAQYFRLQLDGEIARLQRLCNTWMSYREENHKTLSEDYNDLINLAIGQTQLLINKKLEQFRGLVRQCEDREQREGEGIVTVQDLQGFWDMVYMQVENVDIRFNKLEESKNRNWIDDEVLPSAAVAKKKNICKAKPKPKSSSGLKAMILAARMKSKTGRSPVGEVLTKQTLDPKSADTMTFNGGFFSVISPVKNKLEEGETPGKRVSLLKTVVASEAKKRLSTKTPPTTAAILKASCLAKNMINENYHNINGEIPTYAVTPVDLNKTPGKSILKTPGTLKKSSSQNSRRSVKVLFANDGSDDEQDIVLPTRRSGRLSAPKISDDIYSDVAKIRASVLQETDMDIEIQKPTKRARITRQNAISNVENVAPFPEVEIKSTSNERGRRRSVKNEVLIEAGFDNHENITQPKSKSRRTRLTLDFQTDLKITDSAAIRMDDRLSFNLISFSPEKPVRNTRYALRRMSTSSPTVKH